MSQLQKALDLAKLGMSVFPVRVSPDPARPGRYTKTPLTPHGLKDGTEDPDAINRFDWSRSGTEVGVWAGASGLCALDIDVKRDASGTIVTDGYDSLESAWLEPPVTFTYPTVSGEGTHWVYRVDPAQEGLNGRANYRGLQGIDRRAGNSYFVWYTEVPTTRDEFESAPEWLLDTSEVRSRAAFSGTVEDWFASLEPGSPNILVRKAIERVRDDFSHSDMVSAQHEAIRLGAEGNSGVPDLIARLEEAWLARPTDEHTTPEGEWEYKFAEALASGIEKYGDAIDLRKSLPPYSPGIIPREVPDAMVTGMPGDKQDFNTLLRALILTDSDDLTITSIMWSAQKTSELAREWGLQFVHKRVVESRTKLPPERENPTLDRRVTVRDGAALLTREETEWVLQHPTFIDEYIDASREMKGWVSLAYAIPSAWTLLSMAFGDKAFLPMSKPMPLNLWFIALGESGTGKTAHYGELESCLNLLLKQPEETYFNVGATSSPEAIHTALLERDNKSSMVLHDEASDFFEAILRKDWMSGTKDFYAKVYDGDVAPQQKIRLKELKGKSARTSFCLNMIATPDRTLSFLNLDMWYSGFLVRVNWTVVPEPDKNNPSRYEVSRGDYNETRVNPVCYDLVGSIMMAQRAFKSPNIAIDWTDEAEEILRRAHQQMDEYASKTDNYKATGPAVTRLGRETTWKCAALLALYRGERVIRAIDALTALYYVQQWFDDMFKVVEAAGNGDFAKNMDEIEAYIGRYSRGVSEPKVYDQFKKLAKFSKKDVDSLLEYLMISGRILRRTEGSIKYMVNGANGGGE